MLARAGSGMLISVSVSAEVVAPARSTLCVRLLPSPLLHITRSVCFRSLSRVHYSARPKYSRMFAMSAIRLELHRSPFYFKSEVGKVHHPWLHVYRDMHGRCAVCPICLFVRVSVPRYVLRFADSPYLTLISFQMLMRPRSSRSRMHI